jgi:2-polyprenyl-6-methoxyphenol hydroxylase-like FAD-dependent oxidoreductase
MADTDVLVTGAGPTGLVLAYWLKRLGVRVRIVDKTSEPGTTSRALGVQARTLEFYRQVGLADALIDRGLEFVAANLWVRGKRKARAAFGEMGQGLSPYPYMLIFPQDEHERLLIERLAEMGSHVERQTELLSFDDRQDRIVARIRAPDGREEACEGLYLAGCDGGRSTVRHALGIGFPGGTYARFFYVADVEASGALINGELHVALDDAEFLAVFPMKGARRGRIIGTVRSEWEPKDRTMRWQDLDPALTTRLGITVERVNWFSTFHVHHRVADAFGKGRVFLAGDAAHIHSPVGAQGMNTGIADAVNLAWKLAAVVQGSATPALLETYEPERIAFARRLVATTDQAFTAVTSPGVVARFIRTEVVPRIMPPLFARRTVRRFMFRTISQTAINYRHSSLSEGRAGAIRGGDRLPWVPADQPSHGDNFAPLRALGWQVHVYGDHDERLVQACEVRGVPLHVFTWGPKARDAGLERGALYLVRPDGYVGLADSKRDVSTFSRYLDSRGVVPGTRRGPSMAQFGAAR